MSHQNSQVKAPINDRVLFIGLLSEAFTTQELAPLHMTVEQLAAQMKRGWAAISRKSG
jgi:hypothetical protein